jgi:ectoine hydroxylase-related dioxygenase (phytanoyl-CoA dioxygenase family)
MLDPLDLNIEISDEEHGSGVLSTDNERLGALLLHTRGYVILRNAIPQPLVTELRAQYQDMYEKSRAEHQAGATRTPFDRERAEDQSVFWERGGRFRIFPKLTGPFADRYVLRNPFVDPLISAMLGNDYYCKFMSSDTAVRGSTYQAPHRDIGFYGRDDAFGYLVNIPLMHCGLHNGPLEVWPGGSHLWRSEQFARFKLQPFVQDGANPEIECFSRYLPSKKIELHPGEVLVRDPGMWHRGTPNETDEPRIMLTSGFFRRDYYYHYGDTSFNLDVETYRQLPEDIAQLFSPMFDKTDLRYWKMRRDRALRGIAQKPHTGEALRGARRWARRTKNYLRDRRTESTD